MSSKGAGVLVAVTLVIGSAVVVRAQQDKAATKVPASAAAKEAPAAERQADPRIAPLLALAPAERRAELKKMRREERRGLWFALKREEHARRPGFPGGAHANYATMEPRQHQGRAFDAVRVIGTIQYDSGAFGTSFGGGQLVGNRFDTHTGIPVLDPGTVSEVQAVVVPGPAFTTSSAGFVLHGPQTGGGGAMALFSTFTGATGVTDTVTFAGLAVNYTGSFFVLFGDFANSYIPVFGTGTTNAQGHHALVGYTGGMGPNITGTFDFNGTLNGFVRATGNIVPVELMSFDVG